MRWAVKISTSLFLSSIFTLSIISGDPSPALARDPRPVRTSITDKIHFADPGEDPHLSIERSTQSEVGGSSAGQSGYLSPAGDLSIADSRGDGSPRARDSFFNKFRLLLYSIYGIYFR